MPGSRTPRLPEELKAHIENAGGEDALGEGWMAAYRYALAKGNVHKGCCLYADAHHSDFADVPASAADDDDD